MGNSFVSIRPAPSEDRSIARIRPWNIAFVVPRYGREIVGGAETLARAFAENLPAARFQVEVLTTCAVDHHTWRNVLPSGEDRTGAARVRRFPVSPRDERAFLAVQERISAGFQVDFEEELAWAAGSVNSEELYGFLESQGSRYHALLFLPYLFGTTLLGSRVMPDRSIVIPCLHDEGFAHTRVVNHLFQTVRGWLFNSIPERRLAVRLFGVRDDAPVVGMGFEAHPSPPDVDSFRARYGLTGDYLLYFGRKEGGKNLPLLLECFASLGDAAALTLVLAGDGSLHPGRRSARILDLPRLHEAEKRAACAGALAVCQPSTNESFSIVLMEAWLEGRPVLVNGRCDVTRGHAQEANGGLWFTRPAEFAAEVEYLRGHAEEAREMGRLGREYVLARYSWRSVIERFESGLREFLERP